jgi:hypothetical protein
MMGEMADLRLNGEQCQVCGEDMGRASGFPRTCWSCESAGGDYAPDDEVKVIDSRKARHICPICQKRLRGAHGLREHMQVKHGTKAAAELQVEVTALRQQVKALSPDLNGELPQSLRAGASDWIQKGILPGQFLEKVIRGDITAILHADPGNQAAFKQIVQWWVVNAPAPCWGSDLKVRSWRNAGGEEGIDKIRNGPL